MSGVPSVFVVAAFQASVAVPVETVSVVDAEIPPETALMEAEPAATPVTRPFEPAALLTVATVLEELQVTAAVRFCVEPSEYVPVAVKCTVPPTDTVGLAGVIAREVRTAGFTVSVVDADTAPDVAVIVVVPAATDVAMPFEPAALLTVATELLEELQVTAAVRFCVEPSEYVPVAVNCCFVPVAIDGLEGETAIETRLAVFTVRVVDTEMLPEAAVIVVDPAATDVASPSDPAALLIVATAVFEDVQLAEAVRSCVVLSEKVPVAVNCCVVLLAIAGLEGETAIETRFAGFTVRVVEPDTFPEVAVTVVEPAARAVASPVELIVAREVLPELQVTEAVRSCVVLSENVPVAANCVSVPAGIAGLVGVTAIATSCALFTVSVVDPDMLPDVALIVVEPAATEVASPIDPAVLLMVATPAFEEAQTTVVVRSCVVLSENVPTAVNCRPVPFTMEGAVGVIAIETRVACLTERVAEP